MSRFLGDYLKESKSWWIGIQEYVDTATLTVNPYSGENKALREASMIPRSVDYGYGSTSHRENEHICGSISTTMIYHVSDLVWK